MLSVNLEPAARPSGRTPERYDNTPHPFGRQDIAWTIMTMILDVTWCHEVQSVKTLHNTLQPNWADMVYFSNLRSMQCLLMFSSPSRPQTISRHYFDLTQTDPSLPWGWICWPYHAKNSFGFCFISFGPAILKMTFKLRFITKNSWSTSYDRQIHRHCQQALSNVAGIIKCHRYCRLKSSQSL